MRKKAGRRIAVLLAVSMMAAQIPAAAAILPKAVSAANGKQPEWGMTPPEWNVDEDGGATPSDCRCFFVYIRRAIISARR